MKDQEYYNLVAAGLAFAVVIVFLLSAVMSTAAHSTSSPASPSGPAHVYLTVQMNPDTGMPQFSPANFTVPTGEVIFTILDYDSVMNWSGCTCNVTGTVGGTEAVNGTSYSTVPTSNVAHTFTIPSLGLNVLSPGGSTVTFTVDLTKTGALSWFCEDPCGANGYTGAPMGVPGYMSGTMTVS